MLAWFGDISCDCRRRLWAPGRAFTDSRGFLSAADEEKQKAEPDTFCWLPKDLKWKKREFSALPLCHLMLCVEGKIILLNIFFSSPDCHFLVILVQGCGSLFRLFSLSSPFPLKCALALDSLVLDFSFFLLMSGCLWVLEKLHDKTTSISHRVRLFVFWRHFFSLRSSSFASHVTYAVSTGKTLNFFKEKSNFCFLSWEFFNFCFISLASCFFDYFSYVCFLCCSQDERNST